MSKWVGTTGEQGCCSKFLRGEDCIGRCTGLHLAREERPPCPRWLAGAAATGGCPFASQCFFPHRLPAALRTKLPGCRAAVQVRPGHCARAVAFVREQLDRGRTGLRDVVVQRAHGSVLKHDHVLLLLFDDAPAVEFDVRAWLDSLRRHEFLETALVRCFLVDAVVESVGETAEFFERAFAAPSYAAAVRARVHAFPKALESEVADALAARLALAGAPRVVLAPGVKGCGAVVSVVHVGGVFYVGLDASAANSPMISWGAAWWGNGCAGGGGGGTPRTRDSAVCRAEYKLKEVAARTGVFADLALDGRLAAVDIGAAPGGWTQCLLRDLGFATVFAVDPGDVPLADALDDDRCEHMRMLGLAALTQLAARSTASGAPLRLSALVQDANCPSAEALECYEFARAHGLLAPGCAVVVTLKNFDGKTAVWERACADAEAQLGRSCGGVQRLHLFRNGAAEVTLTGVFQPTGRRSEDKQPGHDDLIL